MVKDGPAGVPSLRRLPGRDPPAPAPAPAPASAPAPAPAAGRPPLGIPNRDEHVSRELKLYGRARRPMEWYQTVPSEIWNRNHFNDESTSLRQRIVIAACRRLDITSTTIRHRFVDSLGDATLTPFQPASLNWYHCLFCPDTRATVQLAHEKLTSDMHCCQQWGT